ncbi:adenine nucleotide alpha hydrolases-like protein [Gymnopus androsaceus JB14]|uniref:tRNA(Ile)-lysidine synthetase n=1 Tax=Gymnopus androsaceus JB14 TaxID=1447944 RepID=A0A6A4HJX8_9AGAR|nr:adenine nucleotide alpha hydrolases-like protein [Gymnopus androsaceus JB14]
MNLLRVRPISRDEFIKAFRLCKPLAPWPDTIAIGNSGGPDSTSLLFLIHRYLSENSHIPNLPRRVVSLHVNHGLQAASEDMAQRCATSAKSIGVEHHTLKVPWSRDNFPELPSKGSVEESARDARDPRADGAAGMKPCRRWGMSFGYFGAGGPMDFEGMRRWIVRPLLNFPKDRLLATCEENKLSYVTDETNFQPELTLRNALRHWLTNDGKQTEVFILLAVYVFEISNLLSTSRISTYSTLSILQKKLKDLDLDINLSAGVGPIYSAVKTLALQANDIDDEVDLILSRNPLRSPAGTYLITHQTLASIENPKIQRAVVLRILRYASFHPWGSLAAQVKRRSSSVSQIIDKLWSGDATIPPFCAGGGVAWNPVAIQGDKFRFVDRDLQNKESFGWLASRQNPPSNLGLKNPLRVNITPRICSKLSSGDTSPLEILYDNRFLVTINLAALPPEIEESIQSPDNGSEIWLLPRTRWFWPQVIQKFQGEKDEIVLHFATRSPKDLVLFPNLNERDVERWQEINWRPLGKEIAAPWIQVDFMRPLTTM